MVQYSSIHEAVKKDDAVEMQSMVQQGAGLNDVDPDFKFTPLHWAAHQGSLEVESQRNSQYSFHGSMLALCLLCSTDDSITFTTNVFALLRECDKLVLEALFQFICIKL